MTLALTGPADLRDQRWLDERVEAARGGIEAVIDIALNWTEGREVGRLHPGVAPADYVREHVGLVGREAIVPLLTESNWSNRQIAAVAGVSEGFVRKQLRTDTQLERPTETLGADGKLRSAPRLEPADPYFAARAAPVTDYIEQMPPDLAAEEREFRLRARWSALIHRGTDSLLTVKPEDFVALLDAEEREDTERLLPLIESWIERTRRLLAETRSLRVIGGSK